ncbi:hypothetical protein HY312_04165 [Candidatus Saccharibacteria bacterium]|nr:hypothetical protein [Candidatus Saccharibacteria bacterium]
MFKIKANRPYTKWNKQQNPFVATRIKIGILLLVGVIAGLTISFFIDQIYRTQLQNRSVSFALSINASDVSRLKNQALADDQVPYADTKLKLSELKDVYEDSRFVYIMDKKGDDVRFLADSEAVGSEYYSPRLQKYEQSTPELISMFTSGKPMLEGPVTDTYGVWYSSLAPIRDESGAIVAVIGVDVPAARYLATIGGIGFLIFLIAIIWSILIYFYDRQRNRRFEAFRLQVELMSIASHELRTPLSGIRWGQEVLLGGKLDETQEAMTRAMYDSTLQLQESIEDILQLASIGSNKSKQSVRIPVDISELIDATTKVQQLPAQQKEITFEYDPSWKAPIMVDGDATQLRRVFNNLVSNAIKYASIGSQITMLYEYQETNHLIIIKNKGIGVPQKELAHIFDGFYRATNAIEKQVNGTGMGLYLSRQTVEQHGGKLWIESVENESTTAYVSLPLAKHVDTSIVGSNK